MSTLVQQVLDADGSGSEARLLGMFLAQGERPAAPRDFVRAPFELAAAVRVSASLFHDALATAPGERCRELWLAVGARWLGLSRRAAFRRWLRETGVRAGLANPDGAADKVADQLLVELLGDVHDALSTEPNAGADDRSFHTARQLSITGGERRGAGHALRWEQRLSSLRNELAQTAGGPPVRTHLAAYAQLIRDQPDECIAWQLADEAAAAAQTARVYIVGHDQLDLARGLAYAASDLVNAAPHHYRLRRAWAQLLMLQGLHAVKHGDSYNAGGLALARAAAIDPLDHQSDELLNSCRASLRGSGRQLHEARHNLSIRGRRLLHEYQTDMKDAFEFSSTVQWSQLRDATLEAATWELTARLGLDASSASARAATKALVEVLTASDGTVAWDAVREVLVASHTELAQIDWQALEVAAEGLPDVTTLLLTEALPPRSAQVQLSSTASFAAARSRLEDMPAVARRRAAEPRIRRAAFYHWAMSRDSLPAMAMAIAGAVLLISAVNIYHSRRADAEQRESAYVRFEHAVSDNDTATALVAAEAFLGVTRDATLDFRSQALADRYATLLVGELERAGAAHRTDQLTRITGEMRALRSWLVVNPRPAHGTPAVAVAALKETP